MPLPFWQIIKKYKIKKNKRFFFYLILNFYFVHATGDRIEYQYTPSCPAYARICNFACYLTKGLSGEEKIILSPERKRNFKHLQSDAAKCATMA